MTRLLEKAKEIHNKENDVLIMHTIEDLFPELKESEDDKVREELIKHLKEGAEGYEPAGGSSDYQRWLAWLEKQKEPLDKGEISDGYHTFNELYYYRMLYNAAFFNLLPKEWVHKSKKHHTGEECFGGGWFIVMAELPTGQISNHYEMKDWDLFDIPEKDVADEWDGHTPQEAAERLHNYLLEKQAEQKKSYDTCDSSMMDNKKSPYSEKRDFGYFQQKPKFKVGDWVVQNGLGIYKIVEVCESWYEVISYKDGIQYSIGFDKENDCHLWTIQDAKEGDVLSYVTDEEDLWIMIYWSLYEPYEGHVHYHALLINDNFSCKGTCCICIDNLKPATKEQRDLFFQKMEEAGYEWDAEKKGLSCYMA